MAKVYIGTSGFSYDHWKKVFYPEGLAQAKWLSYYARFFDTVEMNVTFYRLPRPETFQKWHEETPEKFYFAAKGSRLITHYKRLKNVSEAVEVFFTNCFELQEKLGVVLWQTPKGFKFDPERLENFCREIKKYEVRQTFEFRDQSWFCAEVYEILSRYDFPIVLADWPFDLENERFAVPQKAEFVYLRRHGPAALYASLYSEKQIEQDKKRIEKYLSQGQDVYIYFNNDAVGNAVKNALELKEQLS